MSLREEKKQKRAILLNLLNQDSDWMNKESSVDLVQNFVAEEFDSEPRTADEQIRLSGITEENFLQCIYKGFEYVQIQQRFKLPRTALNLWRKNHGFYKVPRNQLKQQYEERYLSKSRQEERKKAN